MNIQRIRIGVPIQNRFSYKVPFKASVIECGRSSSNKGNRFVIIDQFYFFHYASDYIDIFLCTDFAGEPVCDGSEMQVPDFLSFETLHNVEEISEGTLFPPFRQSLQLLVDVLCGGDAS